MQERKETSLAERGFTLIEMLVVIAILGILAAVVVFSVAGTSDRAAATACSTEAVTVNDATQAYYVKSSPVTPVYPAGPVTDLGNELKAAQLLAAGSPFPGATKGHAMSYNAATGVFTVTC